MTEEASGQTDRTATATKTESLLTWQHWCRAHSKSPNLILSSSPVLLLSTAIKISLWGLLVLESHFHGLPAWTWEFKFCHRYHHPGSVDNGIAKKVYWKYKLLVPNVIFFKQLNSEVQKKSSSRNSLNMMAQRHLAFSQANLCFRPSEEEFRRETNAVFLWHRQYFSYYQFSKLCFSSLVFVWCALLFVKQQQPSNCSLCILLCTV